MAETLTRLADRIEAGASVDFTDTLGENAAAQVAEKIRQALVIANQKTYTAAGNIEHKRLDTGVAGLYEPGSGTKSVDTDFLVQSTAQEVAHVLLHEDTHHRNKAQSSGVRVTDIDVEEALTEASTVKTLGDKTMAYHQEIGATRQLAREMSTSFNQMVRWYESGANEKINAVINQAANNNKIQAPLAA